MSIVQTNKTGEPRPQISNRQARLKPALRRRSFIKRLGIAGVTAPASALLMSPSNAKAEEGSRISRGDIAILRFLAAAEILETDLWQQYTELALGNESFQQALMVLDGDMPTYVNQNTRDEFTRLLSRICGLFPARGAGLTCDTGLFP